MYYGQRTESRCVTVLSCGISGLEDGTHSFRWSVRASILIMHLRFFMNCQKAQLVCVFIDVPWSVRRIPTISWCKGRWPPFCALFRAATVPWIATHVPPWFFFVCVCVLIKKALVRTAASQYTKLLCVTTTRQDWIRLEYVVKNDTLNPDSRKFSDPNNDLSRRKLDLKQIQATFHTSDKYIHYGFFRLSIANTTCSYFLNDLLLHEW